MYEVWYDHQEDGYEPICKVGVPMKNTTEIWGDGNCNNGFAPKTTCTSPEHDILKAGQSIVLENDVLVTDGAKNNITYNGGDKIMATYPIAITRGAYPRNPGSLMAGGVEVLDIAEWGTFYVVPVGQNAWSSTAAFQHTAVYVMAKDNNTIVEFSDGTKKNLTSGQSYTHIVSTRGMTILATAPIQVDLIIGDIDSTYELRWYALIPRDAWTNSYLSPVGDTKGGTKIYLYNPSNSALTVTVTHSDARRNNNRLYPNTHTISVPANSSSFTNTIPSGTGAELTATNPFIALSLTDTVDVGQLYDWGFPVLPTNKLSEKVLIGWGYGCTNKNCNGGRSRSVVFVSPFKDADIYVDLNNDGTPESGKTIMGAKRLSSNIIENGADMSGAIIWAVEPGMPFDSMKTVPIAAAWGQFADYSFSGDGAALDLGTLTMLNRVKFLRFTTHVFCVMLQVLLFHPLSVYEWMKSSIWWRIGIKMA